MRVLEGHKVHDDRNIDIREIALAVDQRRDSALRQMMFENINSEKEGWVLGDFVTAYCDTPIYDSKRKLHKLSLRYEPFSMVHDKGVWFVGFPDDEENPFIPMRNGGLSLLRGMDALSYLENESPIYFLEGNSIFIRGLSDVCELLVKQVAATEGLDDEDDYPVPSALAFDIVLDVLALYGVRVPRDEVNDDIDQ